MANKFWVLGTGTWDNTNIVNWSTTSGGTGGAAIPTTGDTVTFDANSGGGTVTVNTTVNITNFTMGAFTGTLDFSVNNNNVTCTTFSGTGTATRTLNMGSGTWTFTTSLAQTAFDLTTTTGLTFSGASASLVFTPASSAGVSGRSFITGGKTYGAVTISDSPTASGSIFTIAGVGWTFASLALVAPVQLVIGNGGTITAAPTWSGTSANPLCIVQTGTTTQTLTLTSGNASISWAYIRGITFSGGTNVATNSFDGRGNSGITITGPSGGVSGGSVIGG